MKAATDIRYTEEMFREAMEMLERLKHHMGMFQNQYYGKLKKRYRQHEALNESLRVGLNAIDTIESDKRKDEAGIFHLNESSQSRITVSHEG